jgi:hypothetical protein
MADRKISDLTALTTPASGDYLPIVDISEAAAASKNKRITIEELMRGVPDGTAAAPGIAFETDPNTGIYRPGADQLAVATNGTGRLFIDASGNVGVGDNNPATKLHVKDNTNDTSPGSTALVRFESTGAGTDAGIRFKSGVSAYTQIGGIGGNLYAYVNGTERLRITSAGLVGIGTSVARGLLTSQPSAGITITYDDASGDAFFISNQNITGGSGNFGGGITWGKPENGGTARVASIASVQTTGDADQCGLAFFTKASASNAADLQESLRVTHDGKVGIGVTSPDSLMHLESSSSFLSISNSTDTGEAGILFRRTDNNQNRGLVVYDYTADALKFRASDNGAGEDMRIDSSGRLLVGTSTAQTIGNSQAQIEVSTDSASGYALSLSRSFTDIYGPQINFRSTKGTAASPVIVDNGDQLGSIAFYGYDGTDSNHQFASITAFVDGTPGNNDCPGRLAFSTTADGAASSTERMRITNLGFTKISSTNSYNSTSGKYHEFRSGEAGDSIAVFHNTTASFTGTIPGVIIKYTASSPNDTSKYFLYCEDSTALRAGFRSNGGLANYSANNANLSDRNVKKDISLSADTWDCVKEWEIVNYRYKDQPDDTDLNLGVIAQQVAESCPEVITIFQEAKEATETEPAQEERLGVKEQQMYWMAIKALQEAQARIEQLEQRLTDAGIA